ncbi:MAG: hypothetical protein L0G19_08665, partial [Micrococcales bacterium]|nr:hypothetical protein [Micrococcales bacterium]
PHRDPGADRARLNLFQRCIKPLELPASWQFQGFSAALLAARQTDGMTTPTAPMQRTLTTSDALAVTDPQRPPRPA